MDVIISPLGPRLARSTDALPAYLPDHAPWGGRRPASGNRESVAGRNAVEFGSLSSRANGTACAASSVPAFGAAILAVVAVIDEVRERRLSAASISDSELQLDFLLMQTKEQPLSVASLLQSLKKALTRISRPWPDAVEQRRRRRGGIR